MAKASIERPLRDHIWIVFMAASHVLPRRGLPNVALGWSIGKSPPFTGQLGQVMSRKAWYSQAHTAISATKSATKPQWSGEFRVSGAGAFVSRQKTAHLHPARPRSVFSMSVREAELLFLLKIGAVVVVCSGTGPRMAGNPKDSHETPASAQADVSIVSHFPNGLAL